MITNIIFRWSINQIPTEIDSHSKQHNYTDLLIGSSIDITSFMLSKTLISNFINLEKDSFAAYFAENFIGTVCSKTLFNIRDKLSSQQQVE